MALICRANSDRPLRWKGVLFLLLAFVHVQARFLLPVPEAKRARLTPLPSIDILFYDETGVPPIPKRAAKSSRPAGRAIRAHSFDAGDWTRQVSGQSVSEDGELEPSPLVQAADPEPDSPVLQSMLSLKELALLSAGKADRELRGGVAVSLRTERSSAFGRLNQQIDAAYRGGSDSMAVYESPDGVRITRVTRKGRTRCYISGIVDGAMAMEAGRKSSAPRSVNCPSANEEWRPRL